MRGQFPGAGFSGTSTRLPWIAHQDPVGHTRSFGGACTRPQRCGLGCGRGWCARASDFLGKSWGILEPAAKSWGSSAGNSGKIWDSCIIRRHRSRVHQSRPEKRRDLSHVTQPCERINVSCSLAGLIGFYFSWKKSCYWYKVKRLLCSAFSREERILALGQSGDSTYGGENQRVCISTHDFGIDF